MSVSLDPARATALPAPLRNSIYSALLSSGGIRNIESTLTQLLQSSGFQAQLRSYITDLFRTGQATTANDAYAIAMARVRACMVGQVGRDADDGERDGHVDLSIPHVVVKEGSRVVRRELERVVVIEAE
ncbi:hypothetical protein SVAN01_09665 [Stagonosporopsis vannaccii]|nr:hypothetical protein SVAN01_09665 [Stagonosporopsis vannaccii]